MSRTWRRASAPPRSKWSHWGDSNSRPLDYESSALPAKLQWRRRAHLRVWNKPIGAGESLLSSGSLIEAMEEDPDSDMLSGTPATQEVVQQTVFVNTGPVIPVQKNKAAAVIGWLILILSSLSLLATPLIFISDWGATDINGYPISYPASYFVVAVLTGLTASIMGIIGGWKMTKYQKQGIWIIFGSFAVNWVGGLLANSIVGDEIMGSAEAGAGLTVMSGFCGVFCYAICGLIVAIPLMLSDGGME